MSEHPTPAATDAVVLRLMPAPFGQPPEARFGDRLRDARQQLGLSIEALSRLCKSWDQPDGKGISPPTLGRYESGETLPGLRELRLLADALGVPVQWLVTGVAKVGSTPEQVEALANALRAFIAWTGSDQGSGSSAAAEGEAFRASEVRRLRLAEAKRPTD